MMDEASTPAPAISHANPQSREMTPEEKNELHKQAEAYTLERARSMRQQAEELGRRMSHTRTSFNAKVPYMLCTIHSESF